MALPPLQRRALLITIDALLLPIAVWLSFWLRLAQPFPTSLLNSIWLLPSTGVMGLVIYAGTGQYKGLTRYAGSLALYRLALRNGLIVLSLVSLGVLLGLPMPPRSSWILLWLLLTAFTGAARFVLRDLLLSLQRQRHPAERRVAIYGAGAAGAQLEAALRRSGAYSIQLFVDDDPKLWRRSINGIPIGSTDALKRSAQQIDQVLVAIPTIGRSRRREIVHTIQGLGLPVLQVPPLEDIAAGRSSIDALRPIAIEELLGRDSVPPDPRLLGPGIAGCCVCVTGAGGSIGGELCRQILRLSPSRLVLLEISEPALYTIHKELKSILPEGTDLVAVLGSATSPLLVNEVFHDHRVEVVFHAAAYKHVPIVEINPLAGLENNIRSTRVVCQAAHRNQLREVVLISTDKAVRPTNVMGASKRLAELVVQSYAEREPHPDAEQIITRTTYAMVRFGNVLDSSGSVVPLFRDQIARGGPITLTDPEITRYFMTIPEAAQLVLQAAVLAKGGEVFLLDMGEPVKIKDLAEDMVRLSGLKLRDACTPDGDIEVTYTGLRPGEKLYEELLIDATAEQTSHPLIYRAKERTIPAKLLNERLDELDSAINSRDTGLVFDLLRELIPEWQPDRTTHHSSLTRGPLHPQSGSERLLEKAEADKSDAALTTSANHAA